MRQSLDKNGLSLNPQNVDSELWYYESTKGLEMVIQIRDSNDNLLAGKVVTIPYGKLKRSMSRLDSYRNSKKKKSSKT